MLNVGRCNFNSGDAYDGMWKDDKIDGNGVFNYANGERYEGDLKDGKREGEGNSSNNL